MKLKLKEKNESKNFLKNKKNKIKPKDSTTKKWLKNYIVT